MVDIEKYMPGIPEMIIICEHKQTKDVQYIWSEDKFQARFANMQTWWSEVKERSTESTFYEFDPWFDATDQFIKEKEKIGLMKNRELIEYWNRKIEENAQNYKKIMSEQKEILSALKSEGYS